MSTMSLLSVRFIMWLPSECICQIPRSLSKAILCRPYSRRAGYRRWLSHMYARTMSKQDSPTIKCDLLSRNGCRNL